MLKISLEDFRQVAEIIRCTHRAALLPEEMLQEGRGMSRECCPAGPQPCPGEGLFVHMLGGKPANLMPREFDIAPSCCIPGKNQSYFSCKPFHFCPCTSSPLKTLTFRAMLTHIAVVWGEETPYSKQSILA